MWSTVPPVHRKPDYIQDFDRLDMLWERYPQYHEKSVFTTLCELLEEHESYEDGFEELRNEYLDNDYERFLIRLSWSDLPYRYETRSLIEEVGALSENIYTKAFMNQFSCLDTDRKACLLFLDEKTVHYLAVFDKSDMENVLLMFHLLYSGASEELFGGYSLYDYPFQWYQTHLTEKGTVLRSPYLPDRLAP